MFGAANRFKNFLNIAIVPYHIIKIIFILNGSGHVAGYMLGCQFRLRPRGSPVLSFPHESPIPLNHLDSLKTDVSRKKRHFNKSPDTVFPLGYFKIGRIGGKAISQIHVSLIFFLRYLLGNPDIDGDFSFFAFTGFGCNGDAGIFG